MRTRGDANAHGDNCTMEMCVRRTGQDACARRSILLRKCTNIKKITWRTYTKHTPGERRERGPPAPSPPRLARGHRPCRPEEPAALPKTDARRVEGVRAVAQRHVDAPPVLNGRRLGLCLEPVDEGSGPHLGDHLGDASQMPGQLVRLARHLLLERAPRLRRLTVWYTRVIDRQHTDIAEGTPSTHCATEEVQRAVPKVAVTTHVDCRS